MILLQNEEYVFLLKALLDAGYLARLEGETELFNELAFLHYKITTELQRHDIIVATTYSKEELQDGTYMKDFINHKINHFGFEELKKWRKTQ